MKKKVFLNRTFGFASNTGFFVLKFSKFRHFLMKRKMNFTLMVKFNQKLVLKNAQIRSFSQHFSTFSQHFDTFWGIRVKIQPFSSCFRTFSRKFLTFWRTLEHFRAGNRTNRNKNGVRLRELRTFRAFHQSFTIVLMIIFAV